jgi:hypothetical protein
VGSPTRSADADEAVRDAADAAGYDVEREELTTESVAELPGGDETIAVTVTTWTVLDGGGEVAAFTWTSSDSVPGRFGVEECP